MTIKMPDKLYINKYMIRPGMLHQAEFPPDNPEWEYIRKDALIVWLSKCKNNPVITDLQKGNIQDLIDKINSL